MYDLGSMIYLDEVKKFNVSTTYKTFQLHSNASEDFAKVNSQVEKVAGDIDAIVSRLTTLKEKLGDNKTYNEQIDLAISNLKTQKENLVTANTELFEAVEKVMEYIFKNHLNKVANATTIQQGINNIEIYAGDK